MTCRCPRGEGAPCPRASRACARGGTLCAVDGILKPFVGDLYHLAPIPVFYRVLDDPDLSSWHAALVRIARERFSKDVLEVPDERHVQELGKVPAFPGHSWAEEHPPAVGIWHCVPTNGFLDLPEAPVQRLRERVLAEYVKTLRVLEQYDGRKPLLNESWIQFYRDSDAKVLHNHERYDRPFFDRMWAGGYYIDDGAPAADMKYSGAFSFRVREVNYFVRPKPGLLMMWPADILHEVHPFYGQRERVVVNFNLSLEQAEKSTRVGMFLRKLSSP
jgi:hypothetical protein